MARARETWADVGWHEEELEGQTWQQRAAQQSATSAIWLGVAYFATSLVAVTRATVSQVADAVLSRDLVWHKTDRYRTP